MDLAGIRNSEGLALIELQPFSNQVAWLNETIAPDRDLKEMMQWLADYYRTHKLTAEEHQSIIKRSMMYPKTIEPDFLFKLTILCQPLYWILDYRLENNLGDGIVDRG
jgi:hypothetical protein